MATKNKNFKNKVIKYYLSNKTNPAIITKTAKYFRIAKSTLIDWIRNINKAKKKT